MFSSTPYISRLSLFTARVVALMATLLSAWMVYLSLKYAQTVVNWGDNPCIDSAQTRWGYWLKVPIAIPGLLVYLGILILTFRFKPWDEKIIEDQFWPVLIVLVTLAAASGTWLLGAQAALLRYVCPHCLIINFSGMLLFATFVFLMKSHPWTLALSIFGAGLVLVMQLAVGPPAPKVAASPAAKPGATAVVTEPVADPLPVIDPEERPPNTDLTSAIFSEAPADLEDSFAGQASEPLTFIPIVSSLDGIDTNQQPRAAAVESEPRSLQETLDAEEARAKAEGTARTHVTLGSGKLYLKLDDTPFIGKPTAPVIIAVMYDYTMPECVKMLRFLRHQVVRYQGVLGVALLPTPLDHDCNPNLRFTPEQYRNACEYARSSLRVWLSNPSKHLEFELFVTREKHAAPVHQVEWLAEQLVDPEAMKADELARQTERQLGRNTSYWKNLEFGALPKLVFEDGVTAGTPQILEDMDVFMEERLGFKPTEKPRPKAQ